MREKLNHAFSPFLHLAFFPAFVFLLFIGENGEPFALSLLFALIFCGLSPIVCSVFFLLSVLISWNFQLFLIAFFQAVLLNLGYLLQKNRYEKTGEERLLFPFLALTLSLALPRTRSLIISGYFSVTRSHKKRLSRSSCSCLARLRSSASKRYYTNS